MADDEKGTTEVGKYLQARIRTFHGHAASEHCPAYAQHKGHWSVLLAPYSGTYGNEREDYKTPAHRRMLYEAGPDRQQHRHGDAMHQTQGGIDDADTIT
jgi:hypothetical protein